MKITQSLLICLLLLSGALKAAETYSPWILQAELRAAELQDQIAIINTLGSDQLVAYGQDLLNDNQHPSIIKERLLMVVIRSLSAQKPSENIRNLTRQLSGYEPQVLVQMQDGGHMQKMQAFPIASHARALLTDWRLNDSVAALRPLGRIDFQALNNKLVSSQSNELNLIWERLLTSAQPDELEVIRNSVDLDTLSDQQLLSLAESTGSIRDYQVLIQRLNRPGKALAAIHHSLQALPETLDEFSAKQLLMTINRDSAYASTAIDALARLSTNDYQIQRYLLNLLADPKLGGDAAYALSSRLDAQAINQLEINLSTSNPLLQRRSLLSLKQSKAPEARLVLERFAKRQQNKQLSREVLQ